MSASAVGRSDGCGPRPVPWADALLEGPLGLAHQRQTHPRLTLWSAHGGGPLASYVVRADDAWAAQPCAHTTEVLPSQLLRGTFVYSLVYTPKQLWLLVSVMWARNR